MTAMFTPYREMASIVSRFAPHDSEFETAIDGLYFSRRSGPGKPVYVAQYPTFALVAQGSKSLTLAGEVLEYGVGDYLVISVDVPVVSRVTDASKEHPNLGIGMTIRLEALHTVIDRIGMPRIASPQAARGVAVNKAPPELIDATMRYLRLLDTPDDIRAMAPLLEQEILYRLLTGPDGPRLLQMVLADGASQQIRQAVNWLRENFAEPLRIESVADRVGMSVSSFHHHFKTVTGMTPMQYQKQLRLHEARRLMLIENVDVGTAGFNVGYQSPSQFSREYARLYGDSPLRDIGQLRAAR